MRLFDTPVPGRGRQVELDVEGGKDRSRPGRLIADDADQVPGVLERPQRRQSVGVEVVQAEVVGKARSVAPRPLPAEVEIRPEDAERLAVVAAAPNPGTDDGQERQPRDAQPVGPLGPDPGLVDERLPNVEDDRANRYDLSCQEVPPSGAPGSFWCFMPVRLSICSTPRR